MNVPNRYHHSKKSAKVRLKPQAVRARKAALKALKRKLTLYLMYVHITTPTAIYSLCHCWRAYRTSL